MSILCGSVGEKGTHLPVVGHIFQGEKERERYGDRQRVRERKRESVIWHQRCELINTYGFLAMWCCTGIHIYIYRRKVSILCGCVGEKGIHLPKLYVYYCMALLA